VSEGKQLGRPPVSAELEERIRDARQTESVRKVARRFGISPTTVQKISRPFEASAAA
jgi:DNA invertase Pin-like site-specific DNA recombinase